MKKTYTVHYRKTMADMASINSISYEELENILATSKIFINNGIMKIGNDIVIPTIEELFTDDKKAVANVRVDDGSVCSIYIIDDGTVSAIRSSRSKISDRKELCVIEKEEKKNYDEEIDKIVDENNKLRELYDKLKKEKNNLIKEKTNLENKLRAVQSSSSKLEQENITIKALNSQLSSRVNEVKAKELFAFKKITHNNKKYIALVDEKKKFYINAISSDASCPTIEIGSYNGNGDNCTANEVIAYCTMVNIQEKESGYNGFNKIVFNLENNCYYAEK